MVTGYSPRALIGSAIWTWRLSILKFCAARASAMSAVVTEPNIWSFSPVLRVNFSDTPLRRAACFCAASNSVAVFFCERCADALDRFQIAGVGFHGEFARQKEIAGVARLDGDDVAAVPQLFDVFLKNDLHIVSLGSYLPSPEQAYAFGTSGAATGAAVGAGAAAGVAGCAAGAP